MTLFFFQHAVIVVVVVCLINAPFEYFEIATSIFYENSSYLIGFTVYSRSYLEKKNKWGINMEYGANLKGILYYKMYEFSFTYIFCI